jgi:hypothetical protein
MTQIAHPFFPSPAARPFQPDAAGHAAGRWQPASPSDEGFDAAGFELGWDYAHHRLVPPADHLHAPHPVRQGWEAGRAAFGQRTLQPTRHVRRWLALRLQAWQAGEPVEDLRVTPRFLARIEPLQCPVTRAVLGTGDEAAGPAPGDGVVLRVNLDLGPVAGNLAIVSRRAAQARGRCRADEALAIARRAAEGGCTPPGGLDARAWERLAALLRLAEPLPHARIAALPLAVLPPNRLHVRNPAQALQTLLTAQLTGPAYARRLADLGALMPDAGVRRAYFLFMNALLARRITAGWAADRHRVRSALEDAWGHPVIQRRWGQLGLRLSRAACERIVRLAAQRGLMGPSCQWVDDEVAAAVGVGHEAAAAANTVRGGPQAALTTSADPGSNARAARCTLPETA